MKYLVPLMVLAYCQLLQGILDWKVVKKITDYGQNVTLFCNIPNCCPKSAGWDKYTPQQRTIVIDIKTWTPTRKYDGKVLKNGYTLIIQNLTKQDLNISYSCVYESTLGDKQTLLEENVFTYINTTQRTGPIDNRTFSAGEIAGVILGVSVAVSVVLFIVCFWKCRKERHKNSRNSNEGSSEEVPLIKLLMEISKDERKTDTHVIQSRIEIRKHVPVQDNGKDLVEKTRFVRTLIFLEDDEYDETSIDGMEMSKTCKIRKKDRSWFVSEVVTTKTKMLGRIQPAGSIEQSETLSKQTLQCLSKENVSETETKQKEQIPTTYKEYLFEIEKKQHDQESLVSNENFIDTDKLDVVTKSNLAEPTINRDDNEMRKTETKEKQTHDFTNPELTDTHACHGMPADQVTETTNQKLDESMSRANTVEDKKKYTDTNSIFTCNLLPYLYVPHLTVAPPNGVFGINVLYS